MTAHLETDQPMPSTPAMPPSLWAAVTPAGPKLSSLKGPVQADVLVIGAGFTGLSTALHLRRAGIDVAVVEAAEPGWGASGRNNGQVIPTLSRPDPDDIVRKYGAGGERLVALIRDCASILFDTVREERIEAEAEQTGWMQPVHSPGRMKIAERRVKQWSKHGAPVELLTRDEVRSMTGSDAWYGGFWNRSGGHVNPLALTRGLARSVLGRGGRIYANSPVISFRHDGAALGQQDGEGHRAIACAGARHQRLHAASFPPSWRRGSHARWCRCCRGRWRRSRCPTTCAGASSPAGRRCRTRIASCISPVTTPATG